MWCKNGNCIVPDQGMYALKSGERFDCFPLIGLLSLAPARTTTNNRSLKKVFVSIKGVYFQCNIQVDISVYSWDY